VALAVRPARGGHIGGPRPRDELERDVDPLIERLQQEIVLDAGPSLVD
jgi:hypothetical protein